MPIPIYNQQSRAPGNLNLARVNARQDVSGAIGDALGSVGRNIEQARALSQQKQEERAAVTVNESLMGSRAKWVEELPKRQAAAAESGEGYAVSVLKDFDADADERIQAAPTQQSKQFLKERLSATRVALQEDSLQFEARRSVEYKASGIERSVNTARTAVEFLPQSFPTVLAEQRAAIQASGLPAPLQAKLSKASQDSLASASIEGEIRRNPFAALRELNNEKTDNLAVRSLDFDRRQQLRNVAQSQVTRIENEREREVFRREAGAERVISGMDRQLASGIPATPEMWRQWEGQVKGTPMEAEFKARVGDEQEIQSLLSKPIQEQIGYIQGKETELASGGTLTQAANLNRLKTAVNQNLQLLQQSPLIFNERRGGRAPGQLDIEQLASGDGGVTFEIQDRVTDLRSMQKQFGASVPLRPLLPQEAQQLTAALQSSSPQRQAELLGKLSDTVADQAAFKGAMQQISADAPVKAFAGILAGKQKELVTNNRWFRADDKVSSTNVAQTLLEGESILNPDSASKAADGRPKVSLYLPEQNLLQQSFQDAVGDAFRGNSAAGDLAFQAVKSYYVGRAAQTGRIASGKEDIDAALVKESVKAVLGSVSDYNGGGNVLAPWGMDEDKFNDRANTAFLVEASRAGISQERIEQLSEDIGLQNAGDSRYAVTVGNNYLTDSAGKPIILDLSEPRALK